MRLLCNCVKYMFYANIMRSEVIYNDSVRKP